MEVFPDLHHKMSKKIAQLTKVIYHLNTKNEDHQTELDIMSANHQMEIIYYTALMLYTSYYLIVCR